MQNEENNEEMQTCPFCAEKIKIQAKKCSFCGEIIDPTLRMVEENSNPQMPLIVDNNNNKNNVPKNRLTYIILGLFFGGFGAHNFYAVYPGKAIAQLLTTLSMVIIVIGITENGKMIFSP